MPNRPCRSLLLSALLIGLTALPQADAATGTIRFRNTNGEWVEGRRCAVEQVSPPLDMLQLKAESDAQPRAPRQERLAGAAATTVIDIPIALHVIISSRGDGKVSQNQITEQIAVLNQSYAPQGFAFHLASSETVTNSNWHAGWNEATMLDQLAVDPERYLNVYLNVPRDDEAPDQTVLGRSSFPWSYSAGDPQDGVIIYYATLPGGSASPYDQGDSMVHEVGHYLGLFHTFQNGCARPGDYANDTPPQMSPAYRCARLRDTCPHLPGGDPVRNFMNYGDDACMKEFTPDQGRFMRAATAHYRPLLGK